VELDSKEKKKKLKLEHEGGGALKIRNICRMIGVVERRGGTNIKAGGEKSLSTETKEMTGQKRSIKTNLSCIKLAQREEPLLEKAEREPGMLTVVGLRE